MKWFSQSVWCFQSEFILESYAHLVKHEKEEFCCRTFFHILTQYDFNVVEDVLWIECNITLEIVVRLSSRWHTKLFSNDEGVQLSALWLRQLILCTSHNGPIQIPQVPWMCDAHKNHAWSEKNKIKLNFKSFNTTNKFLFGLNLSTFNNKISYNFNVEILHDCLEIRNVSILFNIQKGQYKFLVVFVTWNKKRFCVRHHKTVRMFWQHLLCCEEKRHCSVVLKREKKNNRHFCCRFDGDVLKKNS